MIMFISRGPTQISLFRLIARKVKETLQKARKLDTYSFPARYGLRGRELVSSVGKIMLQGGGTFGVFMSVGTAIRC